MMKRSIRLWIVSTSALVLAALVSVIMTPAWGVEIIPSIGLTRPSDSDVDAKAYGGVALRFALLPFVKLEGGIAYRKELLADGDVELALWPVTASAWLSPLPLIYAGGGVGWYHTTIDYRSTLPFEDATSEKMGVHVGGGVRVPMAPHLGLDLSGRYIFMQEKDDLHVPTKFDPDFWTTSLGLAIQF